MLDMRILAAAIPVVVCLAAVISADAAEPAPERAPSPRSWRPNLKLKTFGGVQFWTDVYFFHGWHIQKNVSTGHFRLLDENDVRHAWGTREECLAALAQFRRQRDLPAMQGTAVVLIHGIGRSAHSMRAIRKRLAEDGMTVVGFNYASTRIDIPTAAEHLHEVLESLEGIDKIHFVVHSMGGLVIRSYLAQHRDKRIGRLVMLGVPNQGAKLASDLKNNWVFKAVWGPAGQQLVKDPAGFAAALPVPDFEFAVIAGSRGTLNGYNPLLPGDDDGTVTVESTRLPGATDFLAVRRLHTFLMSAPEVIEATHRFLHDGELRAEGDPHPIPKKESDDEHDQMMTTQPLPSQAPGGADNEESL